MSKEDAVKWDSLSLHENALLRKRMKEFSEKQAPKVIETYVENGHIVKVYEARSACE